jgi:hypothetical protein
MYSIMLKIFTSLNGDQEIGFFTNTKVEARGSVTDETVALFNGIGSFPNTTYTNTFNDNYSYQLYHQIGFTYREQINKNLAFGIKISALSGIAYQNLQVNSSSIVIDQSNNSVDLHLQGKNQMYGGTLSQLNAQDLLPKFRNPGLSVSIGTSYKDENGVTLQGNIKNLGFIHWNNNGTTVAFNNTITIDDLTSGNRESNIYSDLNKLITTAPTLKGFNTPTDGFLELSATKNYWLNYDKTVKFSPTIIASKEIFFSGFTAALVLPVQYQKYVVTLTPSYNDLNLFSLGTQFMIKTPDSEFFIGSDRIFQTVGLISSAINQPANKTQMLTPATQFTGANFFIGFSFKFGSIIENPMNADTIPDGEKGFLGKLFDRVFGKKDANY